MFPMNQMTLPTYVQPTTNYVPMEIGGLRKQMIDLEEKMEKSRKDIAAIESSRFWGGIIDTILFIFIFVKIYNASPYL